MTAKTPEILRREIEALRVASELYAEMSAEMLNTSKRYANRARRLERENAGQLSMAPFDPEEP